MNNIKSAEITIRWSVLCLNLIILPLFGFSQDNTEWLEGSLTRGNDTLEYRYLLPHNFNESQQYPLVLFLHGAGERGNDNKKQLVHGSKLFADNLKEHPAIVIFPQSKADTYWSNVEIQRTDSGRMFAFQKEGEPTIAMSLLTQLVDSLSSSKMIDKSRIYVGGLSMGGMGTFELVNRRPDVFAAAFPICGGGHPAMAENYNNDTAFWIFHGMKDDIVPYGLSETMAKAILMEGLPVRLTLYPDANHNSWDSAFAEPELLNWIFSKTKK